VLIKPKAVDINALLSAETDETDETDVQPLSDTPTPVQPPVQTQQTTVPAQQPAAEEKPKSEIAELIIHPKHNNNNNNNHFSKCLTHLTYFILLSLQLGEGHKLSS